MHPQLLEPQLLEQHGSLTPLKKLVAPHHDQSTLDLVTFQPIESNDSKSVRQSNTYLACWFAVVVKRLETEWRLWVRLSHNLIR